MATVVIKKEVTRTLILNEEESMYLKTLLQVYLGEGLEEPTNFAIRKRLFLCFEREIEGTAVYN